MGKWLCSKCNMELTEKDINSKERHKIDGCKGYTVYLNEATLKMIRARDGANKLIAKQCESNRLDAVDNAHELKRARVEINELRHQLAVVSGQQLRVVKG